MKDFGRIAKNQKNLTAKNPISSIIRDQIGPTLIGLNFQPKKSLIAIHHWLQSNCAISEESERPKVDIMARNLILDPIWA